jgi:hypothetical protein
MKLMERVYCNIIVKDRDKGTTKGPLVWSMGKMCWESIKRMIVEDPNYPLEEPVAFAKYTKATKSNIFGYVKLEKETTRSHDSAL